MNRFFLRDATRNLHALLDARISILDLGRPQDYADFLLVHARALLPLEQALEAADVEAQLPAWPQHRRSGALRGDLARLGLVEPDWQPLVPIDDADMRMGALYVLEGSRLGGRLLLRQAAGQNHTTFLSHGIGQSLWQDYVQLLDALPTDDTTRERLVEGAYLAFEVYTRAADQIPSALQRSRADTVGLT